ncbi:MAG: DRTGG domain-containing protein [Ignavibacteriae bacterium]|nr:DRTGG domain-containing protein [Ignavibacteriota bacterium]
MLLKEIENILECKNLTGNELLAREIEYCYATDMMSDVLKSCKIGSLLITGLVNQQVIQVAEIMDLIGIVFVSGKEPSSEIIQNAKEKNLPMLTTEKHLFEACGILYSSGLRGKGIFQKADDGSGNTI